MPTVNVLIDHPNFSSRDAVLIFEDEPFTVLPRTANMFDVLATTGFFPSKGQARKNWKGPIDIPVGISKFEVGKKRTELFVHKPPDDLTLDD